MRTPRCYQDAPLQVGALHTLDDTAFQHVCKVLRLQPGAALTLFNGDGQEYHGHLHSRDKRCAKVQLEHCTHPASDSPLPIHIGQCISRGERMDYAIQKGTELGMSQLTPLFSERCEVRLDQSRQAKRQQHWQQIAISACEQSQRCQVPQINRPGSLDTWLGQVDADLKLVLHHHSLMSLNTHQQPASIAVLIGPEGGLTEAEVSAAQAAGFVPLTLGPRVLRSETAPVAALAILQYLWGDVR